MKSRSFFVMHAIDQMLEKRKRFSMIFSSSSSSCSSFQRSNCSHYIRLACRSLCKMHHVKNPRIRIFANVDKIVSKIIFFISYSLSVLVFVTSSLFASAIPNAKHSTQQNLFERFNHAISLCGIALWFLNPNKQA